MSAGDWIQVSITVILVLITGWYAWETRRIVRNMEHDREEMHRPALSLQLISWQATALKLRIQNVGGGPALDIEGTIESRTKDGINLFSWSYPFLNVDKYEEFGLPMPKDSKTEDRFNFEKIRQNVLEVQAKLDYKSLGGVLYKLDKIIPVEKITEDWVNSKMLVTGDHPDRIMPRIAKTLEGIEKQIKELHNLS